MICLFFKIFLISSCFCFTSASPRASEILFVDVTHSMNPTHDHLNIVSNAVLKRSSRKISVEKRATGDDITGLRDKNSMI